MKPWILFYDKSLRTMAIWAASNCSCEITINPNSGPGSPKDPDFRRWSAAPGMLRDCARDSNLRPQFKKHQIEVGISGYIACHRDDGAAKVSVASEVDAYAKMGVGRIMLDEFHSESAGCLRIYKEVAKLIGPDNIIVNEGKPPSKVVDAITCDFEEENAIGIPFKKPKAGIKRAARIGIIGTKTWEKAWENGIKAGLHMLALSEDNIYQTPGSFWGDWLRRAKKDFLTP